jgi:2-desacetyl-2-hydroxyethyl bacteriochlorophyllide A dehydrogenase
MTDATAFWVAAPGRGALWTESLPAPGPGDVVVDALASGISRGTESLVFRGLVPPDLHEVMRAPFQAGAFPAPVKYGYCMVGRVAEGPPDLVGRRVFCLHPHQTRFVVPATAVVPLPDAVPTDRAVLAANAETAVNVLWDAAPMVGARIAVVGGGAVGLLCAWLAARIPGAAVELVDVDPGRATLAAALGVPFALPGDAKGDRDTVIHASGSDAGLATALRLAGVEATVVEASWYGDRPVQVPLGGAFHPRRITLRSSQVGRIPPSQQPRWTYRDRMALALRLLEDPRTDALLTGESAFDDLPALMARLAADPGGTVCHLVRYRPD